SPALMTKAFFLPKPWARPVITSLWRNLFITPPPLMPQSAAPPRREPSVALRPVAWPKAVGVAGFPQARHSPGESLPDPAPSSQVGSGGSPACLTMELGPHAESC